MNQISSYLLLGFEGTTKDLFITFGLDGNATPAPVVSDSPIRNFSLREWRQWKRDDELERPVDAIPEEAATIIEAVALRQSQEDEQDRLDDAQRIEELQREFELRGIESQRIYFAALEAERNRIIDEELQRRLQLELDNQNATVALILMAL